jgi:tetratricopeptide (TPR) repeat protein
MMSSSGSEEKTKANSVSEALNEYFAIAKPANISIIGCSLRDVGEFDNAISAFTKIIELEPGLVAAYVDRGDTYLRKNNYDNALQDFTKVIEGNPELKQLQDAYVRRSVVYEFKNDNEKADADFSKAIELGLRESEAYANRAAVYSQIKDYAHALADYSSAIAIDQKNPGIYMQRAWTYWDFNKGVDALQDFTAALDLHLDKESVTKFLEGPLHEISNIFLPGGDAGGNFPSDFPLSTRILELYNDIIRKYKDLPDGYLHRGVYFMSTHDYENAIIDFSAYLRFHSDDVLIIFLQGVCYDRFADRAQATEHFQLVIRQETIDNIKKIKSELANYPPIDNGIDSNVFLSVIGQISSIEETLLALILFFNLEKLLDKKDTRFLSQELLSMAKYLDTLESNPGAATDGLSKEMIRNVFNNYPEYTESPKAVLERDGWPVFAINAKLSIMEYIVSQVNVLDWGEIDDIPYDQANGNFYRFHEKSLNQYRNLINIPVHFSKQLQYQLIEVKIKKQQEEDQARLDERNKVIADLSHSIKNLISTIIDPLENMKKEKFVQPATIQNALRGANLVREIVNAMNLSFKGSLDDFYFDATHNTGRDSMNLETITMGSLKYSVGNMFDGKFFSNFVHKYFPTREVFNEAKTSWENISQTSHKQDLISFLEKYFFHIEVSTGDGDQYTIGNEKGSAIKLLILFQELIFNAVKYSAFVEKELRFLNIDLTINPDRIAIRVANRFRESLATKTSGIGHIIIDNFAKLLKAQPVVSQKDGVYSVYIEFSNIWEKKNENFVRGG